MRMSARTILMAKHEYKVLITYTEHHSVYVEADNEEEAEEKARDMFYNGETEAEGQPEPLVKVTWSDEED